MMADLIWYQLVRYSIAVRYIIARIRTRTTTMVMLLPLLDVADQEAEAKLAAAEGHLWEIEDTNFVVEHSITQVRRNAKAEVIFQAFCRCGSYGKH